MYVITATVRSLCLLSVYSTAYWLEDRRQNEIKWGKKYIYKIAIGSNVLE